MINLPTAFKNKYYDLLGEKEATRLFASLNEESKKAFRINSLKANQRTSYQLNQPVPGIKNAYYGEVHGNDPEWVSGLVYSQDPAAMFPAMLANVQPGQKVLDLCAAPGGKTTQLGEALKGQGLLVANEISRKRVKILRENLERWGVTNALITNNSADTLAKNFKQFFDVILVDAPCSGEGMFRKNPEAISYWSPAYVKECQERQKEILKPALSMLKPGGKLVYSTCTFSPEEDEQIVSWLVKNYQMEIEDAPFDLKVSHGQPNFTSSHLTALNKTFRFWPQDGLGEGQFAAILRSKGESPIEKIIKKKRSKHNSLTLSKQDKVLLHNVLDNFTLPLALENWSDKALIHHNHVFLPAIILKNTDLKIINNGVELGIIKKKRFEPGHQLAEVLGQVKQTRVINLNKEQYLKYLHGEALQIKSNLKGFVLISCNKLIFSFGKISGQGNLKNFYPKGLRTLK